MTLSLIRTFAAAALVIVCSALLNQADAAVRRARPILLPPENGTASTSCDKTIAPQVRAVLFAPMEYEALGPQYQLAAGINNAKLMSETLRTLGVKDMVVLAQKVNFQQAVDQLRAIAGRLTCGDTLLLAFGGHVVRTPASPRSPFKMADGQEVQLLFSDVGAWSNENTDRPLPNALPATELLHYFTWLRRRGVNVTFLLDGMNGADMAGNMLYGNPEGGALIAPLSPRAADDEHPDLGAFAGIYVRNSPEVRLPIGAPDRKPYGLTTYLLTQTWSAGHGNESARALSTLLASRLRDLDYTNDMIGLTIEASHPFRSPLAVGTPGTGLGELKLRSGENRRIDITNPAPQRGATLINSDAVVLEGKVVSSTRPTAISANQAAGRINPDGSFSVRLALKPGENRITLTAWWGENDIYSRPLVIVSREGGKLVQEGKRYAVIIANDAYKDRQFGALDTPWADAQALADLLAKRYGFQTQARIGEQNLSLVQRNVSKRDMERTLSRLRAVLTPADSLLIYFAGHGIYEKETQQAYWLPVDAEAGEPQTWLSAHDVRTAIQRLDARHVLVVADSCFSGAFRMRAADAPATNQSRSQFLINSMTRPSRMFISSGDNEPVSDGGGKGHSVFARALLDGLRNPGKSLTAGELFTQHIKALVGGKSGQSPQYFPMQEGHEGGEFVFIPEGAEL